LDYEIGHPTITTTVTAWLQMQLGHSEAAAFMPYDSELWEWVEG
jgi:hypothetical protein